MKLLWYYSFLFQNTFNFFVEGAFHLICCFEAPISSWLMYLSRTFQSNFSVNQATTDFAETFD